MKRLCFFIASGLFLSVLAGQVEKTLTVARCQAVLDDGSQCTAAASKGKTYCWRHRGLAKSANDSWKATRTWSTNALEKTRRATEKATRSTQEAFEEAGEELTKLVRENFKKDTTQKGSEK